MNEQEFEHLIDNYITRTSTTYGEMPGEFFLDLLFERMRTQVDETLILSVWFMNWRVNLTLSSDTPAHTSHIFLTTSIKQISTLVTA